MLLCLQLGQRKKHLLLPRGAILPIMITTAAAAAAALCISHAYSTQGQQRGEASDQLLLNNTQHLY